MIRKMKRGVFRFVYCKVDDRMLGHRVLVPWLKGLFYLLPSYRYARRTVMMVLER